MPEIPRRTFVGIGALLALGGSLRCGGSSAAPHLEVPLSELPPGARKTVGVGGRPVELHHGPDGVVARSLLCTHMGCVVRWSAADGAYVCPCPGGRLGAAGQAMAGPPPPARAPLPARVEGAVVRVG